MPLIKALWFLLKIAVLEGAVIWVAERPGTVSIQWLEYTFTVHVGLFLLALLAVIGVSVFLYRFYDALVTLPSSYRYYKSVKDRDKGYRALTLGLTAVAAGDTQAAIRQAERAKHLLPEGEGLPLLLEAQAARLDGREEDAQDRFLELLENEDAAFLGVRGLLQASLDSGDTRNALILARQALALHPKQGWILRTVYDLEIKARYWTDARAILDRAVKAGAISKERAVRDKVAMALALASEAADEGLHDVAREQFKTARRLDGSFVPAVILQAQYLLHQDQRKKAVSLIEKFWKAHPHAALVDVWTDLMPDDAQSDALKRLQWFERLVKFNGDNAKARLMAGLSAIDGGLWGEARLHLEAAEAIRPSVELYKAFAALEDKATQNKEAARVWLERAAEAPAHRVWVCREMGRVYDTWSPIAEPHGSFNTIEWDYPHAAGMQEDVVLLTAGTQANDDLDDTLIEAPKDVKA